MSEALRIGDRLVGHDQPTYIIAEIGINHNGDVEIAKRLIDLAASYGVDAVKFQKRTPEKAVPSDQWSIIRETPWGLMSYIDYKHRLELDSDDYAAIDAHCRQDGMQWFASCWDEESVDFMEAFDRPCYKIASASLTDDALLRRLRATGRPLILSTGMSTMEEIRHAVDLVGTRDLAVLHCTSTYPCKPEELNLTMIRELRQEFDCPIGYSGHEVGLQTSYAAVVLGACILERHVTLDRAMWGSDQAASIEPPGLQRLVRDIRVIESAMGNGVKQVYDSELSSMKRLRRVGGSRL